MAPFQASEMIYWELMYISTPNKIICVEWFIIIIKERVTIKRITSGFTHNLKYSGRKVKSVASVNNQLYFFLFIIFDAINPDKNIRDSWKIAMFVYNAYIQRLTLWIPFLHFSKSIYKQLDHLVKDICIKFKKYSHGNKKMSNTEI